MPIASNESINTIVTPESVLKENPPQSLYVYTEKYGETVSTLKPGFESNVEKYEGVYEVDVPDEVLDICKEISGLGGRALLVGGSVRDAVISKEFSDLDIKPKDFDLEIYGIDKQQLQLILETKFGSKKVDLVGRAFGIMKVYLDGLEKPLDFSIPRKESKTGNEHTEFSITVDSSMTIDEASLRRDLTINSVAYDPLTKVLYDPYGGVKDIKNKTIEVTNVDAFQEDSLRVLRVIQFASRFEFNISDQTKELCKKMVERGDMDFLPRERLAEEVTKLFSEGRKPSIGLKFAKEIGFIEKYWPELQALVGVPQEKKWHPEGDVWTHTLQVVDAAVDIANREISLEKLNKKDKLILVLGALCHDFGKPSTTQFIEGSYKAHGHEPAGVTPTEAFLERLFGDPKAKLISDITKKVLPLVADHLKPKDLWEREVKEGIDQSNAVRRLAKRLRDGDPKAYSKGGNSDIYMLSLIVEADQRGRNGNGDTFLSRDAVFELKEWQTWLLKKAADLNVEKTPPKNLLNGDVLLKISNGKKGGPWMGIVLNAVYADQLDGNINSPEQAVNYGKSYFRVFSEKVAYEAEQAGVREEDIWGGLARLEDPRSYISNN